MTVRKHFQTGRLDEAIDLVIRHHYSRRAPATVAVAGTWHSDGGLFGDFGPVVAACLFSIPPTKWSEDVLELSRLVRCDMPVPLTGLISATAKACRAYGADLLVSYADQMQGHHGGIYQAASWAYAGKRNRAVDGCIVDGVFVPGRSCNKKWDTRSPTKLSEKLGRRVRPHYDEGKHLYWRALNRAGKAKARTLGLRSMPYPKPDQEKAVEK